MEVDASDDFPDFKRLGEFFWFQPFIFQGVLPKKNEMFFFLCKGDDFQKERQFHLPVPSIFRGEALSFQGGVIHTRRV